MAALLDLLAALDLGRIVGVPNTVTQAAASVLVSIAGVAVLGKAIYSVMGYAIPDGTTPESLALELAAAQSRLARESDETREIAIAADMTADNATAVAEQAVSGPTHRADG